MERKREKSNRKVSSFPHFYIPFIVFYPQKSTIASKLRFNDLLNSE